MNVNLKIIHISIIEVFKINYVLNLDRPTKVTSLEQINVGLKLPNEITLEYSIVYRHKLLYDKYQYISGTRVSESSHSTWTRFLTN